MRRCAALIAAVAFAGTLAACNGSPTASTTETDGLGLLAKPGNGKGKPPPGDGGGSGDVTLDPVSFQDIANSLPRVEGDGAGPYSDGVDEVRAVITEEGQLQLYLDDAPQPSGIRKMRVTVVDAGSNVLFDGDVSARLQTRRASESGGLDLNALPVHATAEAETALRIRWLQGVLSYTLRFGRDCIENEPIASEMIAVRHPADGTWVASSEVGGSERTGRLCIVDTSLKGRAARTTPPTVIFPVSARFVLTATASGP